MEIPKIVEELLADKAQNNNTIDLDAYANGLLDMYQALQLHKTHVSGSVSIKLEDWDYSCGDGCCYSYGTKLLMNGKELEHPDKEVLDNSYVGNDIQTAITAILTELGFNVTFE